MMESAHTYMYTCLCTCVHRDRLGLKFVDAQGHGLHSLGL